MTKLPLCPHLLLFTFPSSSPVQMHPIHVLHLQTHLPHLQLPSLRLPHRAVSSSALCNRRRRRRRPRLGLCRRDSTARVCDNRSANSVSRSGFELSGSIFHGIYANRFWLIDESISEEGELLLHNAEEDSVPKAQGGRRGQEEGTDSIN